MAPRAPCAHASAALVVIIEPTSRVLAPSSITLAIVPPFQPFMAISIGDSAGMGRAPIPNDIIQEIIDILAQPSPNEDPARSFEQVKKFSTLSSFCLQQVRKHIFFKVTLRTNPKAVKDGHRFATLAAQVSFFTDHQGPLHYIRHLSLQVQRAEMRDGALQVQLYDIMLQLSNLTVLDIHATSFIRPEHERTISTPNEIQPIALKSIQEALYHLLCRDSSSLTELSLRYIGHFPINELRFAINLRRLKLSTTWFLEDSEDTENTQLSDRKYATRLEHLELSDYVGSSIRALLLTGEDGQLLYTFPHLKSLAVDIDDASIFTDVSELLQVQRCRHIEELELNLNTDDYDGNNDYSQAFAAMILSFTASLRRLTMTIFIESVYHDPFGGLCSALERMTEDNVLTCLNIRVTVDTDCDCTTGREWVALDTVLAREKQWRSLREVNLKVVITNFLRQDDSLQTQLEELRETHFGHLLSSSYLHLSTRSKYLPYK